MENQNQQQASITVADLQAVLSVIDVAADKGAFTAKQFSEVGKLYDRISSFVDSVLALQAAKEQEAAKEQGTSEKQEGAVSSDASSNTESNDASGKEDKE